MKAQNKQNLLYLHLHAKGRNVRCARLTPQGKVTFNRGDEAKMQGVGDKGCYSVIYRLTMHSLYT